MDIAALKEKLAEDQFDALEQHLSALTAQRDAAVKESINGRKSLKAKIDELTTLSGRLMEKLGIDSADGLDDLPDMKGQADVARQFDVKLKRLERQLADVSGERDAAVGKFRSALQKAALASALSKHEFIDRDVIEQFISSRLVWEGDDLMFKADDEKMVSIDDGVAGVAKVKPHLLKSAGAGGSGYRPSAGRGPDQKNPWMKDTLNLTEQVRLRSENPQLAAQLQAQAKAAH